MTISTNTQAILLLTAPLIVGRRDASDDLLTPGEYKRLARVLDEQQSQPPDLLGADADQLLSECGAIVAEDRLRRLLDRGFLLSQAIEQWQSRAIWVLSSADDAYPTQLTERLGENAPPVLYGCGDTAFLDEGGLAVVGSRDVDDALLDYATAVGRLAAGAECALISGGARGIDRAAMGGALEAGGCAIGILADRLEQQALARDARDYLLEQRLLLISPYDPRAGFNVGNAMQRNKVIYALSDAALVVSSDYKKGGTWAGAIEQLEKHRFVTVYARADGRAQQGLDELRRKGALPWPNPTTARELRTALIREPHAESPSLELDPPSSAIQRSLFDE